MKPQPMKSTNKVLDGNPDSLHPDGVGVWALPVTDTGGTMETYWKPSAEELDVIVGGGWICVAVLGDVQPTIAVQAVKITNP